MYKEKLLREKQRLEEQLRSIEKHVGDEGNIEIKVTARENYLNQGRFRLKKFTNLAYTVLERRKKEKSGT